MILEKNFYSRPGEDVARDLLGKYLVCTRSGEKRRLIITETECYHGFNDKACHGYRGRTPRNEVIFDTIGFSYVYLIYGIYWLFNITTFKKGFPSAVLIRGGYDIDRRENIDGPGKLTKYLGIDERVNKQSVYSGESNVWIEESEYKDLDIKVSERIGIDYAQECKEWLWRFYLDPIMFSNPS